MAVGSSRPCTIVLHDDRVSSSDVLGGLDVLAVGDVAFLSTTDGANILVAAEGRAAGQKEVSLHIRLGASFGFANRTPGSVTIVEDEGQVAATHVDIFFRDQYLSRTDMWLMTKQLENRVVYEDSQIYYLGHVVATVRGIHLHNHSTKFALVHPGRTKTIVRSGSARFTILVQLSKEMLEYCHTGDLMYEKMIEGFLVELFQRWEDERARHLVSVVIFGRYDISNDEDEIVAGDDFYRVLHLDTPSQRWHEVLSSLKLAFNDLDLSQDVTLAAKGNLLEAMHVAAMDFLEAGESLHLATTGTSVIAITAGSGMFEADYPLLRKTTHILLGHSIGVDIVSLAEKPVHPVPIFKYCLDGSHEFSLPHWVDISYWSARQSASRSGVVHKLIEHAIKDISLPAMTANDAGLNGDHFEQFDRKIFASCKRVDDKFKQAALIHPSTSLESNRTMTVGSPPAVKSTKLLPSVPPLKQRPSSSSIATTISLSKQSKSSGSIILSGRKISVGPRGLAPLKSSAITTISETHANHGKEINIVKFAPNETKSGLANQIRASLNRRPSQVSLSSRLTDAEDRATQPIDILREHTAPVEPVPNSLDRVDTLKDGITGTNSGTPKAFDGMASSPHMPSLDPGAEARTPWLTLRNPCNVTNTNMRIASQYRQWQHVFPKAIDTASFKWTSMCTPASLPLYNDLYPSAEDLKRYYKRSTRRIICWSLSGPGKHPDVLLNQLVTLRLIHGFQIVMQRQPADHPRVVMSIGADYHELQCLSELELEIVEYSHDSTKYTNTSYLVDGYARSFSVVPLYDRTSTQAAANFAERELLLDWKAIDQSIDSDQVADSFFRMRFVLLPVDVPRADTRTSEELKDLTDDEKRIDGIQRLTQQWQRHRVFSAEDQSHQMSIVKKKGTKDEVDHNPLAIEYHTRDPSALVNSQDVAVSIPDNNSQSVPLFQESEKYHSSNFDITKLVRQMQEAPPQGVEMRDRRWMARIHLRCFRGDEMTNWLLSAFKDLKTREDAVDIGNELVDRGIFTHVRHKHTFRDGNYFYQIAQSHRSFEYPNAIAGVFNRAVGRSIPPTPSSEARMSPLMRPTRGDADSNGPDSSLLAPMERKQVLLSQSLRYNVDTSKRSQQEEVINVHYDRIHNPDNCYHIHIDWTLTTPMLIREAVAKWAALVEPYGLRLTQLPWSEAIVHSRRHPFEQPIHVKLALEPPDKVPATPHSGSSSLTGRVIEDRRFYHKAILRKLGFVLDNESADSYSSNVEVVVTWGSANFSMTQFVHKSGLVMAQISDNNAWDYLLLPNTLVSEKPLSSRTQPTETVQGILRDVRALAADARVLKKIYEESVKPRIVTPSPFNKAMLAGADFDVPPIQLPPLVINRGL
ncbi:hypothetical protein AMS68_004895 [Peltaster fructicola]|uniref:Vacuolar membrane-associated protein IML1 n=1 Tax=Peltaster fructicola TaxID=286661 RepID=A0A6H0XXQ7_9PEZI|nr:hypothetical protein AMS68_004895 [Peltaster fructicola]